MRISDWSSEVCSSDLANDEVMLSTGTATSLVVLNGVGRRGMAARFAGFLSVNGYSSTRLGDTLPTRETELLYPVEQSAVAKAIAAQLPFEVRLTPSPKVQSITLAIGQDAARLVDHLRRVQGSALCWAPKSCLAWSPPFWTASQIQGRRHRTN